MTCCTFLYSVINLTGFKQYVFLILVLYEILVSNFESDSNFEPTSVVFVFCLYLPLAATVLTSPGTCTIKSFKAVNNPVSK